jgi:UDP-hydrolysing UDP-N-acetyl-D-glucosamine 2-epimerase
LKKLRIVVVITARPSYSRVKSFITLLNNDKNIELLVVASAGSLLEKYGAVVNLIRNDGFNVVAELNNVLDGSTLSNSVIGVGLSLIQLSDCLTSLSPDYVVTIADRYETIATAISSAYLNIKTIHIQGGEITGSIDNKVRNAVSHLSDLHFVSTSLAKSRLIRMGFTPENVFNTGCPSIDLAREVMEDPENLPDDFLCSISTIGNNFSLSEDYIVVLQHPDTDQIEGTYKQINETLLALKHVNMPIVLFWPNIDAGSDVISKNLRIYINENPLQKVKFIKNLEGKTFLKLLKQSKVLVGNSSVGIRECSFLGLPVVNIGNRQNKRERSCNVIDVGYSSFEIINAINRQLTHGFYESDKLYGDGFASLKMYNEVMNIISKDNDSSN